MADLKTRLELTRRHAMKLTVSHFGAAIVATQGISALGCSDGDTNTGGSGGAGAGSPGPSTGGSGTGGATGGAGGVNAGGAGGAGGSTAAGVVDWASGGTVSMTDEATYPDPFTENLGSACVKMESATLGPCYAATLDRRDVSEGYTGLPVRLALLVVDDACDPIPNAIVDIWHTSAAGLYSGDDTSTMCTTGDPDAESHRFFRGIQTTNADGRVDFDTCFPGWYSGRAIHIHFQVRVGNTIYLTSQLFFPQSIIAELFGSHPDYVSFGQPNVSNASDSIYFADGELEYAKMTDGAMLAWKVLVAS